MRVISGILFLLLTLFGTQLSAQRWVQKGLDIDGEAAGDECGWSVSISGDGGTVAVGAYLNDGSGTDAGHVRIFRWDGSSWAPKGLDIDGEAAIDQSGYSVSLSSDGNLVAIGARNNYGNGTATGHVRVYEWGGTSWVQKGLDMEGDTAGDWFGTAVSMSANGLILAIGADGHDGGGALSGLVRIQEWSGSAWVQKGSDIEGESAQDRFGSAVSIAADGNTVAIGAYNNGDSLVGAGHVRVYSWGGSSWTQKGLDIRGEAAGDGSGNSVSMNSDGSVVAVGAYNNGDGGVGAGHVRVFAWNGTAWDQRGLDIDGQTTGDRFGWSVSVSSDGNTLAVGAYDNDSLWTNAGQVRVFSWDGTVWDQYGACISGEVSLDRFGYAVSLSADATTMAAGSRFNDGAGVDAGHVRVFREDPVGIPEQVEGAKIFSYPNPTTGSITVDLGVLYPQVTWTVRNLLGQVLEVSEHRHTQFIQTELMGASGIYHVEISVPGKKPVYLKVLKE